MVADTLRNGQVISASTSFVCKHTELIIGRFYRPVDKNGHFQLFRFDMSVGRFFGLSPAGYPMFELADEITTLEDGKDYIEVNPPDNFGRRSFIIS